MLSTTFLELGESKISASVDDLVSRVATPQRERAVSAEVHFAISWGKSYIGLTFALVRRNRKACRKSGLV